MEGAVTINDSVTEQLNEMRDEDGNFKSSGDLRENGAVKFGAQMLNLLLPGIAHATGIDEIATGRTIDGYYMSGNAANIWEQMGVLERIRMRMYGFGEDPKYAPHLKSAMGAESAALSKKILIIRNGKVIYKGGDMRHIASFFGVKAVGTGKLKKGSRSDYQGFLTEWVINRFIPVLTLWLQAMVDANVGADFSQIPKLEGKDGIKYINALTALLENASNVRSHKRMMLATKSPFADLNKDNQSWLDSWGGASTRGEADTLPALDVKAVIDNLNAIKKSFISGSRAKRDEFGDAVFDLTDGFDVGNVDQLSAEAKKMIGYGLSVSQLKAEQAKRDSGTDIDTLALDMYGDKTASRRKSEMAELTGKLDGMVSANVAEAQVGINKYPYNAFGAPSVDSTDSSGFEFVGIAKDTGTMTGLQDEFNKHVCGMAREYFSIRGIKLKLFAGYRSVGEQNTLYKNKQAAEPASTSPFTIGLAIGVNEVQVEELNVMGLLSKYGLVVPVGGDATTIEPMSIQYDLALFMRNPSLANNTMSKYHGKGGGGWGAKQSLWKEGMPRRNAKATTLMSRYKKRPKDATNELSHVGATSGIVHKKGRRGKKRTDPKAELSKKSVTSTTGKVNADGTLVKEVHEADDKGFPILKKDINGDDIPMTAAEQNAFNLKKAADHDAEVKRKQDLENKGKVKSPAQIEQDTIERETAGMSYAERQAYMQNRLKNGTVGATPGFVPKVPATPAPTATTTAAAVAAGVVAGVSTHAGDVAIPVKPSTGAPIINAASTLAEMAPHSPYTKNLDLDELTGEQQNRLEALMQMYGGKPSQVDVVMIVGKKATTRTVTTQAIKRVNGQVVESSSSTTGGAAAHSSTTGATTAAAHSPAPVEHTTSVKPHKPPPKQMAAILAALKKKSPQTPKSTSDVYGSIYAGDDVAQDTPKTVTSAVVTALMKKKYPNGVPGGPAKAQNQKQVNAEQDKTKAYMRKKYAKDPKRMQEQIKMLDHVSKYAKEKGVPISTMRTILAQESELGGDIHNEVGGAYGIGQFKKAAWSDMNKANRNHPDMKGLSTKRNTDPRGKRHSLNAVSYVAAGRRRMVKQFGKEFMDEQGDFGYYAPYYMGPGAASTYFKRLRKDPNAQMSTFMSQKAMDDNHWLKGKSVVDIKKDYQRRFAAQRKTYGIQDSYGPPSTTASLGARGARGAAGAAGIGGSTALSGVGDMLSNDSRIPPLMEAESTRTRHKANRNNVGNKQSTPDEFDSKSVSTSTVMNAGGNVFSAKGVPNAKINVTTTKQSSEPVQDKRITSIDGVLQTSNTTLSSILSVLEKMAASNNGLRDEKGVQKDLPNPSEGGLYENEPKPPVYTRSKQVVVRDHIPEPSFSVGHTPN